MEGDAPIGRRDVVVGLPEHGIETVQCHVLAQQPVSQAIDFQEPLQLLQHTEQQQMQHVTTMTIETANLIARGTILYPHPHRTLQVRMLQMLKHQFNSVAEANSTSTQRVLVQYLLNLQEAKLICSPLSTG